MSLSIERLAERLVAWRIWLLLASLAVAASLWPVARQLTFERSLESMFAAENPLLLPFRRLQATFGASELVLAVYSDPQLLASEGQGIRRLAGIRRQLAEVPGVRDVLSLDQIFGAGGEWVALRHTPPIRGYLELFSGYTHGADGQTAALVCLLEPAVISAGENAPAHNRAQTIASLRGIMQREAEGMITGEPVMLADGFRHVEADGRRLTWLTSLLLAAVILVTFRSLRWALIPLVVVQFTLLVTEALVVLSGVRLSMVSSMLHAIVSVVGVAACMHVILRFRERRALGESPAAALAATGAQLAAPTFWSCLTDALGFSALLLASVGPVHDFGLMTGLGAALVLAALVGVLPGLALAGRFHLDPHLATGERQAATVLLRVLDYTERHALQCWLLLAAVALPLTAGVWRLEVETDFTRNFRAQGELARAYAFVEEKLGGAGAWDIILPAPAPLTGEYLARVRRLGNRLRGEVQIQSASGIAEPGLTKVLSLADAVHLGLAANGAPAFSLPVEALQDQLLQRELEFFRRRLPFFYQTLYAPDAHRPGEFSLRLMLRSRERQRAADKQAIIRQVAQIAREEFPEAEVTGHFVLLAGLIDSLLADQWLTFAAALAAVGGCLAVAFRSVPLAMAALVPNVLPPLAVLGGLGHLGVPLNMGAVMIAAVSVGLSVDSSIHYITAFQRACRAGASCSEGLRQAQQTAGRAMLLATVALVIGFLALAASEFVPTIYFGTLVSLTLVGGLLGNVVLLPLLVRLLVRK